MLRLKFAGTALSVLLLATSVASAQTVTAAPGWLYSNQMISGLTQSCVQSGPGGTFVGSGPGFTGNAQSILFVTESGGERLVASGLNSIGDCLYDAATDTLFVTDNALEVPGAVTGDTVFAFPAASTASALVAMDYALVVAGSIPSASGITMDAAGDLYVSDSVGSGAGNVRKISGGVLSTLVGGFDFTGGVVVDAAGDLYVAESLSSFENQISRYDSAGVFQSVVSGPTFSHGSYDLVFDADDTLLVTGVFGGDVVRVDPADGSGTPFASGFTFATGAEQSGFTGRVQLVSSTFVPEEEDSRLHKLVPVDRLVAGKGSKKNECLSEFFGLELVAAKAGKKAKKAICVDGEACDSDGVVNDVCTYPIGFCLNVDDARFEKCAGSQVVGFELKKTKPTSAALEVTAASIAANLPVSDAGCFFSDGIQLAVKIKRNGTKKKGAGVVKVRVDTDDAKPRKDVDVVKLHCLPAAQ